MYPNKVNLLIILFLVLVVSIGCNLFRQASDDSTPARGDGDTEEVTQESEEEIDLGIAIDEPELQDEEDSEVPQARDITTVVRFGKGRTSRSYSNAVVRGTSNIYILEASRGQNMSVRINSTENNAVFRVIAPNGRTIGAASDGEGIKRYNSVLPSSGKYRISVTPTRGNATYNITFAVSAKEVEKPISSGRGLTTVVRFRKGRSSASYSNAVIRGERNTYILGASGGQLMSVSISSIEANAVFNVVAPNGRRLASGRTSWSGQLPVNGKYRITVGGTRGNATYRISFAVR